MHLGLIKSSNPSPQVSTPSFQIRRIHRPPARTHARSAFLFRQTRKKKKKTNQENKIKRRALCEVCRSDIMDEIRNLVPDPADPGLSSRGAAKSKKRVNQKTLKRSLYKKKKTNKRGRRVKECHCRNEIPQNAYESPPTPNPPPRRPHAELRHSPRCPSELLKWPSEWLKRGLYGLEGGCSADPGARF